MLCRARVKRHSLTVDQPCARALVLLPTRNRRKSSTIPVQCSGRSSWSIVAPSLLGCSRLKSPALRPIQHPRVYAQAISQPNEAPSTRGTSEHAVDEQHGVHPAPIRVPLQSCITGRYKSSVHAMHIRSCLAYSTRDTQPLHRCFAVIKLLVGCLWLRSRHLVFCAQRRKLPWITDADGLRLVRPAAA